MAGPLNLAIPGQTGGKTLVASGTALASPDPEKAALNVAIYGSNGAVISSSNPVQVTQSTQTAGELQTTPPLGVASGRMVTAPAFDENAFTLPALSTKVVATNTLQVYPGGRIKGIWVVVTTALTWVTSAVPTMQLYGARSTIAAVGGATTGLPLSAVYLGAAQNMLAGAGTTITINNVLYWSANLVGGSVGGTNLIALGGGQAVFNDGVDFVGVEFNFPSALTGGAMTVYLEQVAA